MGRDGGKRGASHAAATAAPLFSNINDWAVWAATGVLCSGAFARHGVIAAGVYWALTAAISVADPSLHSLQMLNLAAVVYDLSFELHRLYQLVRAVSRMGLGAGVDRAIATELPGPASHRRHWPTPAPRG